MCVMFQGEYAIEGALERRIVARRSEDGDFSEIKLANDALDDEQVRHATHPPQGCTGEWAPQKCIAMVWRAGELLWP